MKEKFTSLEPEKKERIINASMAEFSLRGYEKASTNEIVKEAGISKGLLFHYFASKKQLYLYLYDYAISMMQKEFFEKIDFEERELFKKLRTVGAAKLGLQKKHPELFGFVLGAYTETAPEIREDLAKRNLAVLSFNNQRLFQNVDTSRLKEGLKLADVLNVITWTIEGMVNDELKKCKFLNQDLDYDSVFAKADQYFDMLEKLVYVGG